MVKEVAAEVMGAASGAVLSKPGEKRSAAGEVLGSPGAALASSKLR